MINYATHPLHVHEPIIIGGHVVTATASRDIPYARQGYAPGSYGIYLDALSWPRVHGVPAPLQPEPVFHQRAGRTAVIVRWPDFGVIAADRLRRLVRLGWQALQRGHSLEVGCVGAHGRTGTYLAALLMRAERLAPGEAIAAIRQAYCSHAVETRAQERLLYELAGVEVPAWLTVANDPPPVSLQPTGSVTFSDEYCDCPITCHCAECPSGDGSCCPCCIDGLCNCVDACPCVRCPDGAPECCDCGCPEPTYRELIPGSQVAAEFWDAWDRQFRRPWDAAVEEGA